jgi:hypothetical protein
VATWPLSFLWCSLLSSWLIFLKRFATGRFYTPLKELEIEDFPGFSGRRSKAALTLTVLWGATVVLH